MALRMLAELWSSRSERGGGASGEGGRLRQAGAERGDVETQPPDFARAKPLKAGQREEWGAATDGGTEPHLSHPHPTAPQR